ncbi:MAG: hypothetical protein LV479_06885 [Methylacidiphilales bacterium]|nr:hypothetical protein [Candidatus Methylacidiphilales bacterium]
MKFRILFLAVAIALLAGCGLSDQQKADYATVARSGVSPAIYDKMTHGDPLSINDVIALSRARVSDGIIVRYIRDQGTVYFLNPQDFDQLQKDGVSPSVIDFMARTGRPTWGPGPYPYPYPYPPVSVGIGIGGHWH